VDMKYVYNGIIYDTVHAALTARTDNLSVIEHLLGRKSTCLYRTHKGLYFKTLSWSKASKATQSARNSPR